MVVEFWWSRLCGTFNYFAHGIMQLPRQTRQAASWCRPALHQVHALHQIGITQSSISRLQTNLFGRQWAFVALAGEACRRVSTSNLPAKFIGTCEESPLTNMMLPFLHEYVMYNPSKNPHSCTISTRFTQEAWLNASVIKIWLQLLQGKILSFTFFQMEFTFTCVGKTPKIKLELYNLILMPYIHSFNTKRGIAWSEVAVLSYLFCHSFYGGCREFVLNNSQCHFFPLDCLSLRFSFERESLLPKLSLQQRKA